MKRFSNAREAKEFLVSRTVDEAQREGVPLSEVERKMLYFSETGWTLPDIMEVNDEFDSECDQIDYERKIAGLIAHARKRDREENREGFDSWSDAIRTLGKEDHYILVMVQKAHLSTRPPADILKLWGTGMAIVAIIGYAAFLSAKYNVDFDKYLPSKGTVVLVIWATTAALALAYVVLRFLLGKQRMDGLFDKMTESLLVPSRQKRQEKQDKNS
jgi:hypothetical protein